MGINWNMKNYKKYMVESFRSKAPLDEDRLPVQSFTWEHIKVIGASSLGTIFEWYDFYLYGSLASIIASHFFSQLPPGSAFVMALLTFATGFAVRPFGAIIFGALGDRFGRKKIFLVAILLMGASTCLVGVLPTFNTIGILAPVLLVLLRCLQGLSLGGVYGGAATYVAEYAPPGRRGLYTSFIQATICFGLMLSLVVIIIVQSILGEENFKAWGWRIPFLFSVFLLGLSVFIRMKLEESPAFNKMKASGGTSKSPLKESFCKWPNLRIVNLSLFGAIAGEAAILYMGQFYGLFFMTQTLKIEPITANVLHAIALFFSFFAFLFFGWLADKIGRKPIMMVGFLISALTYYPIFLGLTHYGNPDLEHAMANSPVILVANSKDCAFQFAPSELKEHIKFTSSCDVIKALLNGRGVSYSMENAKDSMVSVKIGNLTLTSPDLEQLESSKANLALSFFKSNVSEALIDAGYPIHANPDKVNKFMLVLLLFVTVLYVAMTYGPIAAWLVEMFPARIRYTSMSLPYHIGNGWIGGFLPTVGFALVLYTGNIYSGLWYPIAWCGISLIVGMIFLKDTNNMESIS